MAAPGLKYGEKKAIAPGITNDLFHSFISNNERFGLGQNNS